MQITSLTVNYVYYSIFSIVVLSSIRDMFKPYKTKNPNFGKTQFRFLVSFFCFGLLDQSIGTYINVLYKEHGFSRIEVGNLRVIQNTFSFVGGICAGFFLNFSTHRTIMIISTLCKSVACFLVVQGDFIKARTGAILNGFASQFSKICVDDFLVDLTLKNNFEIEDTGALLNNKVTAQLFLDMLLSKTVSLLTQKKGVIGLYNILTILFAVAAIPQFIVTGKTQNIQEEKEVTEKENNEKDNEGKEENKERKQNENKVEKGKNKNTEKGVLKQFLSNPSILIYLIIDASYCYATSIQKLLVSTPYKDKTLPFSLIMASYNAIIVLGLKTSSYMMKYLSIKKLVGIALTLYLILHFAGFLFYDNEVYALSQTVFAGFLDGFYVPLNSFMRKTMYPSSIRPILISSLRVLSSILVSTASKIVSNTSDNYFMLFGGFLFTFAIFILLFLKIDNNKNE